MLLKLPRIKLVPVVQPVGDESAFAPLTGGENLCSVTRAQDRAAIDLWRCRQAAERFGQAFCRKRKPLPNCNGRRVMTNSNDRQGHADRLLSQPSILAPKMTQIKPVLGGI